MKKEVIVLVAICLLTFIGLIYVLFFGNISLFKCGDRTSYNACSELKPYFCESGKLIEKASVCGCPDLLNASEESCISNFIGGEKDISLNYVLRGKKGVIDFVAYENLSNYLSKLPRYIDSSENENPSLFDFKIKSLDEKQQRELLLPLVIGIQNLANSKEDQARIAISLVQNIPFGESNKTARFGNLPLPYQRYPYEVLYDNEGVCGEKSELLVFLLREIGYDSAFMHYFLENHEAVGIKCPVWKSFNNTGYCFIETTGPAIISDYKTEYVVFGKLVSQPEIIPFEGELSFGNGFYEFRDATALNNIREAIRKSGEINFIQHIKFQNLKEKYGLKVFNRTYTF